MVEGGGAAHALRAAIDLELDKSVVLRFGVCGESQADNGRGLQRLGQTLEGLDARRVLTTLDPGDDRWRRLHALGEFALGETQLRAPRNDDARQSLERCELRANPPIFGR